MLLIDLFKNGINSYLFLQVYVCTIVLATFVAMAFANAQYEAKPVYQSYDYVNLFK